MPNNEQASLVVLVDSLAKEVADLNKTAAGLISRDELDRLRRNDKRIRNILVVLFVIALIVAWVFRSYDLDQIERADRDAEITDSALCETINQNRGDDNAVKGAMRTILGGIADPTARVRMLSLVPADRLIVDCSPIGQNGHRFSIQEAIRNGTTTSATGPGAP